MEWSLAGDEVVDCIRLVLRDELEARIDRCDDLRHARTRLHRRWLCEGLEELEQRLERATIAPSRTTRTAGRSAIRDHCTEASGESQDGEQEEDEHRRPHS